MEPCQKESIWTLFPQYFLVSNVWDIKIFIEILILTWIFFMIISIETDFRLIKAIWMESKRGWRNILSNCRCMKIRMLIQNLFQTICCLELISVLNSDCLVRHILINQWSIDLLESEFGIDWKYTDIFIQCSGLSEPVINSPDFGWNRSKTFFWKIHWIITQYSSHNGFSTFRRPCYKHQFMEKYWIK